MDKSIEDMSPSEALRYMRGLYGMKRSEFCEHFGIPLRSLQHWEIGDRKPAPFVIGLMRKCYELERENERLKRELEEARATTEYVAMMADVELEEEA